MNEEFITMILHKCLTCYVCPYSMTRNLGNGVYKYCRHPSLLVPKRMEANGSGSSCSSWCPRKNDPEHMNINSIQDYS